MGKLSLRENPHLYDKGGMVLTENGAWWHRRVDTVAKRQKKCQRLSVDN